MNNLPQYIDQAIQEWNFVAFFAYDNFESVGRGVVALAETAEGIQAIYGTPEYFQKRGYLSVVQQIDAYNPETEFLVHFDATGGTRTRRIGTPEGGPIQSVYGSLKCCVVRPKHLTIYPKLSRNGLFRHAMG